MVEEQKGEERGRGGGGGNRIVYDSLANSIVKSFILKTFCP